jgi:YidC/Oxa1 family membrane protein insertase
MSAFLGVPEGAAYHLVFILTQLLTPVAGGLAAALAIVAFTAAVRLAISPLSFRALRGQAALARIAPQVQALRQRHRKQPERFQRELAALYQREKVSPFGGFLPLLAQWPFLSVMYLLFRSATVHGAANQLLTDGLFGVPLGARWLSGAAGVLSVHGAVFLAVLGLLAALCWLSSRLARRTAPAGVPASAAGSPPASSADPAAALANSAAAGVITRVLPYVTVAFAAFAPLAAALYLLTTAGWTYGERCLFARRAAARERPRRRLATLRSAG